MACPLVEFLSSPLACYGLHPFIRTSTASVSGVRTDEDAKFSPVLLPFTFWKFGEKAFDVRLEFGDGVPVAGCRVYEDQRDYQRD